MQATETYTDLPVYPGTPYRTIVANNPVNWIDPYGESGAVVVVPLIELVVISGITYVILTSPEGQRMLKDILDYLDDFNPPYDPDELIPTIEVPKPPMCDVGPPPPGDPEDFVRICIAACRKVYKDNFFKRQVCILGCILGAF